MARGEIVSWLNSDDTILPGAVRHAVRALTQDPRLGAVYGEGYTIDHDGNVIGQFGATEPFNLWKLIYLSDYILQQTVYFRRSVFDDVGFVDERLNWGMDWELLMRIGKKYPLELIPEYMGSLREYGAAKTFSGGFRRIRELVKIMRRHGQVRYPPGMFTYGLDTLQRKLSKSRCQNLSSSEVSIQFAAKSSVRFFVMPKACIRMAGLGRGFATCCLPGAAPCVFTAACRRKFLR